MNYKKISVSLTPAGLDTAIRELQAYKKWLLDRAPVFVEELAKAGVEIADLKYHYAVYDGTNDVKVTLDDKEPLRKAVVAVGMAALFIEFGTGVQTWPDNHPEAADLGMVRGSYGKGYGKRKAWVYEGEPGSMGLPLKGDKVLTHGNPANMSMYQTKQELTELFESIAKRVFVYDRPRK